MRNALKWPISVSKRLVSIDFSGQVGRFEPLLEPFELACQVLHDGSTGTDVHLFGRKPLLVNVSPVTVRRLQWYSKRPSEAQKKGAKGHRALDVSFIFLIIMMFEVF